MEIIAHSLTIVFSYNGFWVQAFFAFLAGLFLAFAIKDSECYGGGDGWFIAFLVTVIGATIAPHI